MSIDKDLLDRLMEGRSAGDLFGKEGILSELTKALAERALTTELEEHPGEERAEAAPEGHNHPPDRRNGSSRKTVTTTAARSFWTSRATATPPSIRCLRPRISATFLSSTARS